MENERALVIKTRTDFTKKRDSKFTFLTVRNTEDQFEVRIWNSDERIQSIQIGHVVEICGDDDEYNGDHYINARSVIVVDDDPMKYVDRYDDDVINAYKEAFYQEKASIQTDKYKKILDYLFNDSFCERFFFALPAATQFHHNKYGGLLVHSMETLHFAKSIVHSSALCVVECDEDLLYTAALMHDIGKCWTYYFKNGVPVIHNDEYLYGHSVKAIELVASAERDLGEDYRALKHMMASHQGKPEYNAITTPKTKEAMILHMADYIGSRLFMFDNVEFDENCRHWSNVMKQYIIKV